MPRRSHLATGTSWWGRLAGKIVLETAFDAIEVNAEELLAPPERRGFRTGWGGRWRHVGYAAGAGGGPTHPLGMPTLSGRLRTDSLDCRLGCGANVRVPVALVREYAQPQPRPPVQAVQRIKAVVAELNADDWKSRDRAAAQLAALGPAAAGVLRAMGVMASRRRCASGSTRSWRRSRPQARRVPREAPGRGGRRRGAAEPARGHGRGRRAPGAGVTNERNQCLPTCRRQ